MNTALRGLVIAGGLAATITAVPSVTPLAAQSAGRDLPTRVAVDNTRDVAVVVYLDREPLDVRLGSVKPHTTGVLPLPAYLADGQAVRIFVHPEGGEDLASQDVTIRRGETLNVLVPTNEVGYLPPPPPVSISNPGVGATTVTVDNLRSGPVVVFIERGDFDMRIGEAPANQETTLAIPESLTRDNPSIEIFVHPEHGTDLNSQHFQLKHGAHLLVKVPAPTK
jgi:hypothetical protein